MILCLCKSKNLNVDVSLSAAEVKVGPLPWEVLTFMIREVGCWRNATL